MSDEPLTIGADRFWRPGDHWGPVGTVDQLERIVEGKKITLSDTGIVQVGRALFPWMVDLRGLTYKDRNQIIRWCRDQFGKELLTFLSTKSPYQPNIYVGSNRRWTFSNEYVFVMDDNDFMLAKLTWA